jgi:CRISPR-associated protein Cas1
VRRGSVIVSAADDQLGTVDLDGILSILINSRGATLTSPFIAEAAARNIPVIICDNRFKPVSVALPVTQHSDQTRRFELQAAAKKGLKNGIWKRLVAGKVKNQSALLELLNAKSAERLKRLASKVRPGDPDNIEAQAAQVYWPDLFGADFTRDKNAEGVNTLLNYGYAIIRSSMTSAVISAGLHPTFGLFHKNRSNPLCLVDDLMEPYRPLVDQIVQKLHERGRSSLTPDVKSCLASLVTSDQLSCGRASPLLQHMSYFCYALWEIINGQNVQMMMPHLMPELEVEAIISQC